MIINTVLVFIVFTIFGNQQGVQCVTLEDYLKFNNVDINIHNNMCIHVLLNKVKTNMKKSNANALEKIKDLQKYYLRSIRLLFSTHQPYWVLQTYQTIEGLITEPRSDVRKLNTEVHINELYRLYGNFSKDFFKDAHYLKNCKQTIDLLITGTQSILEEQIRSILLQYTGFHTQQHLDLMQQGRILLLLNESESQNFINLTESEKINTIITLLNDSLVNVFKIIIDILIALSKEDSTMTSCNNYGTNKQEIFLILRTIHPDVINAAMHVFKLQVLQRLPPNCMDDLSNCIANLPNIDSLKILKYYKYYISNTNQYWLKIEKPMAQQTFTIPEKMPSGEISNRITVDNSSNIKPSMFGYYTTYKKNSKNFKQHVTALLDIKLWAITLKTCAENFYGIKGIDDIMFEQFYNVADYNTVRKNFTNDIDLIIN